MGFVHWVACSVLAQNQFLRERYRTSSSEGDLRNRTNRRTSTAACVDRTKFSFGVEKIKYFWMRQRKNQMFLDEVMKKTIVFGWGHAKNQVFLDEVMQKIKCFGMRSWEKTSVSGWGYEKIKCFSIRSWKNQRVFAWGVASPSIEEPHNRKKNAAAIVACACAIRKSTHS